MKIVIDQLNATRAELAQELADIDKAIARRAEVQDQLAKIDAGLAGLAGIKVKRQRKSNGSKPGPKPGGARKRRGARIGALDAATESLNGSTPDETSPQSEATAS